MLYISICLIVILRSLEKTQKWSKYLRPFLCHPVAGCSNALHCTRAAVISTVCSMTCSTDISRLDLLPSVLLPTALQTLFSLARDSFASSSTEAFSMSASALCCHYANSFKYCWDSSFQKELTGDRFHSTSDTYRSPYKYNVSKTWPNRQGWIKA